jgi:hypothetical protein
MAAISMTSHASRSEKRPEGAVILTKWAFALLVLLSIALLDTAHAVIGEPPTVTCLPSNCETCLEYSGSDNRCLKCARIEGCAIDKGGRLPQSPFAKYGRAKNDVDIYNSPVEPRRVIGMMRTDEEAPLMELHPDGWAKLYLRATPDFQTGGNGWVAVDHLRFVIEK